LTCYEPDSVVLTAGIVEPDSGSLSLNSYIPTVIVQGIGDNVAAPENAELTLTGYAPILFINPVPVKPHTIDFTSVSRAVDFVSSSYAIDLVAQDATDKVSICFESSSYRIDFSSASQSVIIEDVGVTRDVGFILLEDGSKLLLEDDSSIFREENE